MNYAKVHSSFQLFLNKPAGHLYRRRSNGEDQKASAVEVNQR